MENKLQLMSFYCENAEFFGENNIFSGAFSLLRRYFTVIKCLFYCRKGTVPGNYRNYIYKLWNLPRKQHICWLRLLEPFVNRAEKEEK
jgi:hypothetical protein